MAERLTCPSCRAQLSFEGTAPRVSYTCPRCLAAIPSSAHAAPAVTEVSVRPPDQGGVQIRLGAFDFRTVGPRRLKTAEEDVAGDMTATGRVLVILAIVSGIGVFGSFCLIDHAHWRVQGFMLSFIVPGGLLLLFVSGLLLTFTQDHPTARKLGGTILNLFGMAFLAILGLAAMAILLVLVCAALFAGGR